MWPGWAVRGGAWTPFITACSSSYYYFYFSPGKSGAAGLTVTFKINGHSLVLLKDQCMTLSVKLTNNKMKVTITLN